MLPIRKISPTKVSLSSYYGKNFVELSRMKANSSFEYISKNIYKQYETKELQNLNPGNVYNNYFKAPYMYNALGSRFKSFDKGNLSFIFDRETIEGLFSKDIIEKLETNGSRICGHSTNNTPLVMDKHDIVYSVNNGNKEVIGDIPTILGLDSKKVPVDFSEFRVFDKYIPIGIVLGYLVGIENLIKLLDLTYVKAESANKLPDNHLPIKFADGIYGFDLKNRVGIKIIAGLLEYEKALKNVNFKDLNHKDAYFILFESKAISSVYIKEMELNEKLFIDPITESILVNMKEPTTFVGLLIRATELLDEYTYPDSQDLTQMRIRGYERIAGFVYKELARSIKTFKNKNINGRSKINLGPYDIWNNILKDNTNKLVEDINPMQDTKERDVITYVGEGGRDKGAIQKEARSFHSSDFGIVSEATVDSSDVAVNAYLSANPNIVDLRGRCVVPNEATTSSVLSLSANLAPFSVNDDGKRVNFINIMNSHIIASVGYEAPMVRTGYEYIIAKRNSDMFAFAAKDDGKVISLNKKGLIVEYSNGDREGVELGRVYGRAEGSYYPHEIVVNVSDVGSTFKKDDILAYNSNFYQRDLYDPSAIILKNVAYAKVALMEANNTFEDASAISKHFSGKLTAKTTKVKSITVNFKQNVHDIVTIGSTVKASDKLMIIEDEISAGYNFDKKSLEILKNLAQQAPSAEYNGIVENIEVLYNGDLEDMSSSLRDIAIASDNRIKFVRKSSNKTIYTGRVTDEYRVNGVPLSLDTMEIKIYITVDNSMTVGDKCIVANQMKSVVSEVLDYDLKTEAGDNIDLVFGFRSVFARIVLSPMLIGTSTTLLRVIAKKAVALHRSK